jgi:lipooligosaccharide transport system ATP-binding protein
MIWQKLRELKARGVTQLLCTQNMEEAARLCDRVAIINQGRIIDIDTPGGFVKRYISRQVWEIDLFPLEREKIISELESRCLNYEEFSGTIHVFPADDQSMEGLPGTARAATLEDVFFKLTGRTLVE